MSTVITTSFRAIVHVIAIALMLAAVGLGFASPSDAAPSKIGQWTVSQTVNCGASQPVLKVVTTQPASIGYVQHHSDFVRWVRREVPAGTYRVKLPRQGFNSQYSWMGVISLLDDSAQPQASRPFTFVRSKLSFCQPRATSKHVWHGRHGAHLNRVCPTGQHKMFKYTLSGVYGQFGPLLVHRLSGKTVELDNGWRPRSGVIQYYDYVGRMTKVDLASPTRTRSWVKGSHVRWNVVRTCSAG